MSTETVAPNDDRFAWVKKLVRDDARKAFVLAEIFGPPVALKRAPRIAHVAGAKVNLPEKNDELGDLYRALGIEGPR